MSGDLKCPACDHPSVFSQMDPTPADYRSFCTGRPGCVRAVDHARHTTPLVYRPAPVAETQAATDGGADPVLDALRGVRSGEFAGYMGPDVVILSREQHDSDHAVVLNLRAENERLVRLAQRVADAVADGGADIVERLRVIASHVSDPTIDDALAEIARLRTENERLWADRAAIAQAVADAVREAVAEAAHKAMTSHIGRGAPLKALSDCHEDVLRATTAINTAAIVARILEGGR